MKIINLNDRKNSLMEIKKRIQIKKAIDSYDFLVANYYVHFSYCINPISNPKKIMRLFSFSEDFTKFKIKYYVAQNIYDGLYNQITNETAINKTIKIKDMNLIGLED